MGSPPIAVGSTLCLATQLCCSTQGSTPCSKARSPAGGARSEQIARMSRLRLVRSSCAKKVCCESNDARLDFGTSERTQPCSAPGLISVKWARWHWTRHDGLLVYVHVPLHMLKSAIESLYPAACRARVCTHPSLLGDPKPRSTSPPDARTHSAPLRWRKFAAAPLQSPLLRPAAISQEAPNNTYSKSKSTCSFAEPARVNCPNLHRGRPLPPSLGQSWIGNIGPGESGERMWRAMRVVDETTAPELARGPESDTSIVTAVLLLAVFLVACISGSEAVRPHVQVNMVRLGGELSSWTPWICLGPWPEMAARRDEIPTTP